jgi:hypothetical protein
MKKDQKFLDREKRFANQEIVPNISHQPPQLQELFTLWLYKNPKKSVRL